MTASPDSTRIPGVAYGARPKGMGPALLWPPRLIVVHDTGNTASATAEAHYAATRDDAESKWTSAHAYVDTRQVVGSVPLNTQAWAAYSYANAHGWQVEMVGHNAGEEDAVPAATVERTAALVAQLAGLADIPLAKLTPAQVAAGQRGICGHRDITMGLHVGDHTDPGPRFDWNRFINLVEEGGMTTQSEFNALMYGWLKDAALNPDGQAYWLIAFWERHIYATATPELRALGTFRDAVKDLRTVLGPVGQPDATLAGLAGSLARIEAATDPAALAASLAPLLPAGQELTPELIADAFELLARRAAGATPADPGPTR